MSAWRDKDSDGVSRPFAADGGAAIKDIVHHHRLALQACATEEARINRLCELNVMSQVQNAAGTSIVQNAWRRGQSLTVHGWVYDLHDGLLRDLECSVAGLQQIEEAYRLKQGDRSL